VEEARALGIRTSVGVPIVVDGRMWGCAFASSTADQPFADDAEGRIADFTELVATAIANAESQQALGRLVDEQAALRRVATLVAHGVPPVEIFSAVSDGVSGLFGSGAAVLRFEEDGPAIVFVGISKGFDLPVGTRWEFQDGMGSAEVYRTGRSARVDRMDWSSASGPVAATARRLGVVSTVVSPIVVQGRLWGAITVSSTDGLLPVDMEGRLEKFTDLVATAIANADSRAELAASRRRIVAASDEARRRIERDLHDGAQQRLVSLALAARAAEAHFATAADVRSELARIASGLADAVNDLQELSRGIHPAILAEGGLGPALRTLARRSAIPVELDVTTDARFPEPIEVAAYYVVSEALANATKHAQASRTQVSLAASDGKLQLSIRDDGVGGANPARGSGLVGLTDRVEALSGSLQLRSGVGAGTHITAELPLVQLEEDAD
jgi:signal transduction histidine kinase